MIMLKTTSEILEIETQGPNPQIDVSISFADHTASTFAPNTQETKITTATTTTVLSAPAASTQRQVKYIKITAVSPGSGKMTVILRKDISGTDHEIGRAVLNIGESYEYMDADGFTKYLPSGDELTTIENANTSPFNAYIKDITKVGVTMEGIGVYHLLYNQAGTPGAWVPGTPGLNGRATDGTTAADNGCISIPNALSGRNFITKGTFTVGVAATVILYDVMWVNSGLAVATTTAQAIAAPVAIPARDDYGTAAGVGVRAAILVTAATTNAGAITNTTISYTNSDGVSGKTGTMVSFPATAVAGTIVFFDLQAGDQGVRSVQSVTLGTSYVTGSISLVLVKKIFQEGSIIANVSSVSTNTKNILLQNGVCLIPALIPTATTSNPLAGILNIEEK
jgi:hypothetical protein